MKKILAIIRRPLFFIVVNFFLVNTLFSLLPHSLGNIVYNIGRVAILFYGGWLIHRRNLGGVRQAALTGMALYFFDHVVLKGGIFLLNFLFKPEGMGFAAFSGVIISFIVFSPLAMLISAAGCLYGRSRMQKPAPDRE